MARSTRLVARAPAGILPRINLMCLALQGQDSDPRLFVWFGAMPNSPSLIVIDFTPMYTILGYLKTVQVSCLCPWILTYSTGHIWC